MRYVQILLGLSALCSTPVSASGQPDPSFGENGMLVVHVDRIQPDGDESFGDGLVDHKGRYVSFGGATYRPEGYFDTSEEFEGRSGLVTRHLPNGQLDPTFAVSGVMHQEVYSYYLDWRHAVELPDGKLLLAGNRQDWYWPIDSPSSIVCRITEAGELDTTFALNGCRALDFYPLQFSLDMMLDMAVMPDGRIVLLGRSYDGGPTTYALARLTADGDDDACFGDAGCNDGGIVFGPQDLADVDAKTFHVAPSGAITVAGTRVLELIPEDPDTSTTLVFRFKPNGAFDSGFGTNGSRRVDYTDHFPDKLIDQYVNALVEGDEGDIVVVGGVTFPYFDEAFVAVARVDQTGSIDTGFATGGFGLYRYSDATPVNVAFCASRQSDGKLLIGGYAKSNGSDAPAALRLSSEGLPDLHFGQQGGVVGTLTSEQYWMYPAAIDSSGDRVVVFGNSAMYPQDGNPALLAFDRDGLFKDAFEND